MKGISPLISAVLLIAFTMAIAAIFGQFAPQIFNQPTNEAVNQTEQLTRCNDVMVKIVEASPIAASVEQVTGDAPYGNFSAIFYYEGTQNPLTASGSLSGIGDVDTVSVSPAAGASLERVRVSSRGCQGAPSQERTNFNS